MSISNINTLRSDGKVGSWGRLVRLHTLLATSLIPLVTYVTVQPLNAIDAISIVAIAGLLHTGICAMNDYVDYEEDIHDPEKVMRPLVSGEIEPVNAKRFSVIAIVLGIVISAFVSPWTLLVTILGAAFATAYNIQSAQTALADVWYVFSIFYLAALGPAVAGGYTTPTVLLIAALIIHGLYQVQEGHMKDLQEDENNILQKVGVKIKYNAYVHYPSGVIGITYGLKTLEILLIGSVAYLSLDTIVQQRLFVVALITIAFAVNIAIYYHSLHMWLVQLYDRSTIVKYITLHEMSSVMLILIVALSYDQISIISLMILTPVYLMTVNYFIHKDIVSPDI